MLSAGISVNKSSLSTSEAQNYTCYIPAQYSLKPSLFSSYLCLGLFRQRFALQQTVNYSLAQYPARSRSESEENVVERSSRARTQGRELGGGKFQRMYEVPDEEERGDKSAGGGVGENLHRQLHGSIADARWLPPPTVPAEICLYQVQPCSRCLVCTKMNVPHFKHSQTVRTERQNKREKRPALSAPSPCSPVCSDKVLVVVRTKGALTGRQLNSFPLLNQHTV